jgi:trimethylamine--corrinoid protein Co-methyltransferase
MDTSTIIQPHLTVLTDGQKEKIHSDSLKILSTMGVRVESEKARKIFTKKLGSNAVQGDIVCIPSEIVEEALKLAPFSIEIYNRMGDLAFQLPGDTRFGIGVTDLYYQNLVSVTVLIIFTLMIFVSYSGYLLFAFKFRII